MGKFQNFQTLSFVDLQNCQTFNYVNFQNCQTLSFAKFQNCQTCNFVKFNIVKLKYGQTLIWSKFKIFKLLIL